MTAVIIWGTDFQNKAQEHARLRSERAGIVVPDEISDLLARSLEITGYFRKDPDNLA